MVGTERHNSKISKVTKKNFNNVKLRVSNQTDCIVLTIIVNFFLLKKKREAKNEFIFSFFIYNFS